MPAAAVIRMVPVSYTHLDVYKRQEYYYAGKYETAEAHKPDYLRVSQAERERAQREKERCV